MSYFLTNNSPQAMADEHDPTFFLLRYVSLKARNFGTNKYKPPLTALLSLVLIATCVQSPQYPPWTDQIVPNCTQKYILLLQAVNMAGNLVTIAGYTY